MMKNTKNTFRNKLKNIKFRNGLIASVAGLLVLVSGYIVLTSHAATCAVSDKLVNSCRPWIGAAVGGYPDPKGNGLAAQIANHEGRIGRPLDIVHDYRRPGDVMSSDDKTLAKRPNTILLMNWKPVLDWRTAKAGNATLDQQLDAMATSIESLGDTKIMVALFHEPENDVSPGGDPNCPNVNYKGNAGTVADYVNMWHYVHDHVMAHEQKNGKNNIVWVLNLMGFSGWDCLVNDLWPGNTYVDWVFWDPYAARNSDFIGMISRFYNKLIGWSSTPQDKALHDYASKPFGLGEWGEDTNGTQPEAYGLYDNAAKALKDGTLQTTYKNLKAYVVWDNHANGSWDQTQYTITGVKDDVEQAHFNTFFGDARFTDSFYTGGGTTPPPPPADTTAPSVPGNVTSGTQTTTSISLTWSASTDNVGVAGYLVKQNGADLAQVTSPSYVSTNLTANTAYSYSIEAYDAAGNYSAGSTAISVKTKSSTDTSAPTAPGSVGIQTVGPTQAKVTWTAATDNVGIARYSVMRDSAMIAQVSAQTLAYTDTTVLPSTTYTYTIRAEDAAGNTTMSQPATMAMPSVVDTEAPSVPTGLAATIVGQQVNLAWTKSTDNIGVKQYVIYRGSDLVGTSIATSFGDNTAQKGQTYSYTVVATDAAGNSSAHSAAVSAIIPVEPVLASQQGLTATYFDNKDLSGVGVSRVDATADFNWGTNAPVKGIPATNFSTRWTGRVAPTATAKYTFYVKADDGVRLWVNDKLIIDDWHEHAAKEDSGTIQLTKGASYNIKLEYFQARGLASVSLQWSSSDNTKQVIPASQLTTSSFGLTGDYFTYHGTPALTTLMARRVDPNVDFTWKDSPFAPLPADYFSVRWTGQVTVPTSGDYTFTTTGNDGVRLWVNNTQLVDDWHTHGSKDNSGNITLQAGVRYPITMEYYEDVTAAVARLYWTGPNITKQIVPQTSLLDR